MHRGAWIVNNVHAVFEYIAETSSANLRDAKSLGGWEQPRQFVRGARVEQEMVMGETQSRFAELLFQHHSTRVPMSSFRSALAAALILYYANSIAVYPSLSIHMLIENAVTRAYPSYSASDCQLELALWISQTRQPFGHANVAALPADVITRQSGRHQMAPRQGLLRLRRPSFNSSPENIF